MFRNIIGTRSDPSAQNLTLSYEIRQNYRWPIAGLLAGILFLFIFSGYGGMAVWMIALYFLIYYLLALGITRVRAEVGLDTRDVCGKPTTVYL